MLDRKNSQKIHKTNKKKIKIFPKNRLFNNNYEKTTFFLTTIIKKLENLENLSIKIFPKKNRLFFVTTIIKQNKKKTFSRLF